PADDVVTWLLAPLGYDGLEPGHYCHHRGELLVLSSLFALVDVQDVVFPLEELSQLIDGQAHQLQEDSGGEALREVRHEVTGSAIGKTVDQFNRAQADRVVQPR